MRQHILSIITAVALAAPVPAMAQADDASFSIMTLNVDGLPGRLLFFNVNDNGPKALGSMAVSLYMAAQNCDIVAMQEDFNYSCELWSCLHLAYEHDEWTGGIFLDELQQMDLIHPQNIKLPCDGLNTAWKRCCRSTVYERVPWNRSFGKFSHALDDMVTKGFRRHEITLANGQEIVVYNLHMDASAAIDRERNRDAKDRQARLAQWEQLRQHIIERLDSRPVVVVGDMNSFYHRDPIKTVFIDAIQATGLATVGDAWVEHECGGLYPEVGGAPLPGEPLDKVLYINPTAASTVIVPTSVALDQSGYIGIDGKPLGDHYPLIARFSFVPCRPIPTAVGTVTTADDAAAERYSLQGIRQDADAKGLVITRSGKKKVQR